MNGKINTGATEAFTILNQNADHNQLLLMQYAVMAQHKAADVPVESVDVGAVFGCNIQGDIPINRVLEAVSQSFEIAHAHDVAPVQILCPPQWAGRRRTALSVRWVQCAMPILTRTSICICTTPAAWPSPSPMPG